MAGSNASLVTTTPETQVPVAIVQMVGGGTTAQRPANPPTYFQYYDTTIGRTVVWTGAGWVNSSPDNSGPQGPQGVQGPQGPQGYSGVQAVYQGAPLTQLVAITAPTAGWVEINLAAQMATLGVTTARAVILHAECGRWRTSGDDSNTLRISNTNGISASSNSVTKLAAKVGGTDRATSDTNSSHVTIPFTTNYKVWYSLDKTGSDGDVFANIYLVGFLY
jgi:hypothetical protein